MKKKILLNIPLIGWNWGSVQHDAFISMWHVTQDVYFLYILKTPGLVSWFHAHFLKALPGQVQTVWTHHAKASSRR